MNKWMTFLAFAAALLVANGTRAADRVKLLQGSTSTGEITEISPNSVTIVLGSKPKKIAVNEVDTVRFDAEPNDLTQARIAVRAGRFDDAQTMLEKIDTADFKRPEVGEDVEYYKAVVAARLALGGNGSKADAGRLLLAFEKAHKNSHHYYELCELIGDMFAGVASNKSAESAEKYYGKLAEAPWPDYKMRSAVLGGRLLVGQKKYDEAAAKFDAAIAIDGDGKEVDRQRLAATLGKASALAGKPESRAARVASYVEMLARGETLVDNGKTNPTKIFSSPRSKKAAGVVVSVGQTSVAKKSVKAKKLVATKSTDKKSADKKSVAKKSVAKKSKYTPARKRS